MDSDYDSFNRPEVHQRGRKEGYSERIENITTRLGERREAPYFSLFEKTLRAFSPGERLALYTLTIGLALSAFALLALANKASSVISPARGGSLTEGVVGPARFINPLLSISGPDKDLTALIYSGLMRATPEGALIPDLADRYEISEDGTTYTFTLRNNLVFHDGNPLTSEDVLFTIQRAQNQDFKSARRADWEGVSVSAPDARTITFTLPHAYAPFLENATIGILPKHLWENVLAEEFPFDPLNMHPVGSGPYRVEHFDTSATGAAKRYELSSFPKFALGEAYIKELVFLFYPNEETLIDAFNTGHADNFANISPSEIETLTRRNAHIVRVPLPRTFGIFFNQNKNPVLADAAVRAALDASIDKKQIVDEVLKGYGAVLEGPIPPGILGAVNPAIPTPFQNEVQESSAPSENMEEARAILSRGGWMFLPAATSTAQAGDEGAGVWKKKDTILEFTLATADEPELSETAQKVAAAWKALGINVNVHVYPLSELNALVLRPRNYEAVLFGEVVGRTLDLFAFWHSSQRNDPGLNLALYTNSKVDDLLARARAITDREEREELYEQFSENVEKDRPAVFLYAPDFIYFVPEALRGVELGALTQPSERFLNVYQWYTDTERVWNIFTNETKN